MSDISLTRLKVAFAFHVAKMIIDADKKVDAKEMLMLTEAIPRDLLDGLNFVDDEDSFTAEYYEAIEEALEVLPGALDSTEKLGLITIFARVSFSDGHFDEREADLLLDAAEFLGLSRDEVRNHLVP